jgi:hypothetical protein
MGRRDRIRRDAGESGGSGTKIILLVLALVIGIPAIVGVLVLCVIFGFTFWVGREAKKAGDEFVQNAEQMGREERARQEQLRLEQLARQKEFEENFGKKKKKAPPLNLPPLQKIPGTNMSDLIPLIDPQQDAPADPQKWQVVRQGLNSELHCKEGHFRPRIEIPYAPPTEYDFIVQFSQPTLRHGVSLLMPNPTTGGGFFFHVGHIKFGGPPGGGGSLLGFGANPMNIEKEMPGLIQANNRYTVTVQVRRNNVRALLDGKELINQPTDYRNLVLKDWRDMRDKTVLAIDCDDPTVFHQVRVIEVTGIGKRLR